MRFDRDIYKISLETGMLMCLNNSKPGIILSRNYLEDGYKPQDIFLDPSNNKQVIPGSPSKSLPKILLQYSLPPAIELDGIGFARLKGLPEAPFIRDHRFFSVHRLKSREIASDTLTAVHKQVSQQASPEKINPKRTGTSKKI
jgi:hypothetical protein